MKKAFGLTFDQGGMGNRVVDFSDRYQRIKVPAEFPRATRMLTASPDLKASEWRTIGIVAFVLLNEVFSVEFPERNLAKSRTLSKLRFFWLLTVSTTKKCSAESDYLLAGSADMYSPCWILSVTSNY